MPKTITHDDIMDMQDYGDIRAEKRTQNLPMKKLRRVAIGPDATAHFENYDTMWQQVHEMLFIERGGFEQIDDELDAYNPLIPNGRELVITLLFEIDDPDRRKNFLAKLGGVEETLVVTVNGKTFNGTSEEDVDRTTADGKASSVQFIHFPLDDEAIEAFRSAGAKVTLAITHPHYQHATNLSPETITELARDFD